MKLYTQPDPPSERLIIEATTQEESDILTEFARPKKPLTATIEQRSQYSFTHLTIRKEQS